MLIKIHYTFIKLMLLVSLILYSLITATSNPHSVVAEDITSEEDPEFYTLDEIHTNLTNNIIQNPNTSFPIQKDQKRDEMSCWASQHLQWRKSGQGDEFVVLLQEALSEYVR